MDHTVQGAGGAHVDHAVQGGAHMNHTVQGVRTWITPCRGCARGSHRAGGTILKLDYYLFQFIYTTEYQPMKLRLSSI